LAQFLEDPKAVRPAPGAAEQVPHQGAEPRAHHAPGARGPLLINRTSPSCSSRSSPSSERGQTFGGSGQAEDIVLERQAGARPDPKLLNLTGTGVVDEEELPVPSYRHVRVGRTRG